MLNNFFGRWNRWGRQNWRQVRRMGRERFAWFWGGLVFGVPMLVTNRLWVDPADFARPIRLLGELAIFVIGGYVGGRFMWADCERRYRATCPDPENDANRPPDHRH